MKGIINDNWRWLQDDGYVRPLDMYENTDAVADITVTSDDSVNVTANPVFLDQSKDRYLDIRNTSSAPTAFKFEAVDLPAGGKFDAKTGVLSWVAPSVQVLTSFSARFAVTNSWTTALGKTLTETKYQSLSINVQPKAILAPRVISVSPSTATAGTPTAFTVVGENLPLTSIMSLVDGICSSPSNQTAAGFTTSCIPGASAGAKGVTISTAATGGVVIDSSRTITITSAPFSTVIFIDNFDGTSLDAVKWSVSTAASTCCGAGNPATYTVTGGYLNIAVPGGSCGFCGVPDGSIFSPKVSALTGDFEVYVAFQELTRTSRDGTGPMNPITLELSNGSTTAGIYVVGDALNNSGTRGHNIYAYAGGAILNAGTRNLSVGQFYTIEFRIRRISGTFYLAHKVAGDLNWTETSYAGIAPSLAMTPKFTSGAGDGGGTRTNSSSTLRIDSFSIKQ